MSRKKVDVSPAPFATVGKTGRCPSCDWSPEGGGLRNRGISMALRIHCYREHGLRLSLGTRRRLPPDAAEPIDLDAEVADHLWIIDKVVCQWNPRPRDEVMQEARIALMSAILQWDGQKGAFHDYAGSVIHRGATRAIHRCATRAATSASKPEGAPLRVMLSPSPDPADTPLATPDDAVRAMRLLTDVQRTVLSMRFQIPASLLEIGGVIGLSKERVRQIEIKALSVLRVELVGEPLTTQPRRRRTVSVRLLKPARPLFTVLQGTSPTKVDDSGLLRRADSLRKRIRKGSLGTVLKVRVVPVARLARGQKLVDT